MTIEVAHHDDEMRLWYKVHHLLEVTKEGISGSLVISGSIAANNSNAAFAKSGINKQDPVGPLVLRSDGHF